jgi:hypothetical protein
MENILTAKIAMTDTLMIRVDRESTGVRTEVSIPNQHKSHHQVVDKTSQTTVLVTSLSSAWAWMILCFEEERFFILSFRAGC